MCGISGVVRADGAEVLASVPAQLACQRHRGPNASGHFGGGRGVVAQNRLSIIDLDTGDPPLTNEDGRVGAVLNGELYNFRALRAELERAGHRLSSAGDTEVLAHLAEEYGPLEIASRLDGMFAFAVWDAARERLVLGRDPLGKKPLYYWSSPDLFVFASEIKGVLAHPDVPRRLDQRAIPAYLTFGYVPTPRTFFDGIRSLPPGHVLTVEPGAEPRIECYWQPPLRAEGDNGQPPLRVAEAAPEVRARLSAAIERRLISDVPLGAFLSGGIDSSTIVALMAELSDRPVATFTIGFDDREGYDERPYARMVAERFGTDHHEFLVAPEAVELVERLVWHHDQPFGDSSAVPTFLLSELTRAHVTVALSGDGGDELFAGYERFAAGLAVDHYQTVPRPVRSLARRGLEALPASLLHGRVGNLQRFAAVAEAGMPEAYLAWLSFVDEPSRRALLERPDPWARDAYAELWRSTRGAHPLDRLLDLNLRTYLLDDLLVKADRMSMAHGLEVRSPFLDRELVEFAISLAPSTKSRGLFLKRALKRAMADRLPPEILRRRKRGFGVPLDRWFREDLSSYVDVTLGANDSRVRAHVVPAALDDLLAAHRSGERNLGHALWTLLTLEVFLRREGW
jgi:asparagine synthase (glutamine-hydrolysing)